jgi:hypothetical protein
VYIEHELTAVLTQLNRLYFQFYIAVISVHALFLSVNQFIICIRHEWRECSTYSPPATVVMLLFLVFEALLFAIFTAVMLGTQLQAIWNDETVGTIEGCLPVTTQMRGNSSVQSLVLCPSM